ncbi:MAG: PRC-barrel domain-containing protein [Rhizobiaceae bacterium]|nr:PRC-barrel domain-containing protein [Rhizobiaceae bacterium]
MFYKLLTTTAVVALLAGSAYAQETTAPAPAEPAPMTDAAQAPVEKADGFLASKLIGETVYNGTGEEAENIGSVNDVVIGSSGQIEAVVVGVGGFLGLGQKNVALNFADISWAEKDGDRWIVVNATKDQLQALAEFDRRPYEPALAAAPAAPAGDTNAMAPAPADGTAAAPAPADQAAEAPAAPADDTTATAPADDPAAAPDQTQTSAIDKSTLKEMPAGDIRSEEIVGTTVYGADDANVGEIGDVILTQDGKVDAVIIDVGGFLGIGEKEVAVGMDRLAFMTDGNGKTYLYTNLTKEQLDAAATYDKSTWAEKRDEQRIMIP